ncbi:hypothetical protein Gotri_014767 [Gossypium trilobum]|uniref:Uncharacterized protein n=1 Tax=Gossypium trilobum TaxID=34281 RepID=A0A7J9DXU6_9ROSI|nr:hypothetical protein [Gossypium trilobum]
MHQIIGGRLKNLKHRALILNSKGSWTKCSWG